MTPPAADSVRKQVKSILVSALGLEIHPDEICDEAVLFDREFGIDSAIAIALLTELEQEFAIVLEDEEIDLSLFQNVTSICTVIQAHLDRQSS